METSNPPFVSCFPPFVSSVRFLAIPYGEGVSAPRMKFVSKLVSLRFLFPALGGETRNESIK